MKRQSFLLFGVILSFSACDPVNQANEHLASMDQSTQYMVLMSEDMAKMQKSMDEMQSELKNDRQYLQALTECMKALSESISSIQKMGENALGIVLEQLTKPNVAVPKTPDAEDLLPPVNLVPVQTLKDEKKTS